MSSGFFWIIPKQHLYTIYSRIVNRLKISIWLINAFLSWIQLRRLFIDNKRVSNNKEMILHVNKWRHNIFAYFTQADLVHFTYKGVHKNTIYTTKRKCRPHGYFHLQYCYAQYRKFSSNDFVRLTLKYLNYVTKQIYGAIVVL